MHAKANPYQSNTHTQPTSQVRVNRYATLETCELGLLTPLSLSLVGFAVIQALVVKS